jgi:hypothetical protein
MITSGQVPPPGRDGSSRESRHLPAVANEIVGRRPQAHSLRHTVNAEESLYVAFSGTGGESPGFWYEASWGSRVVAQKHERNLTFILCSSCTAIDKLNFEARLYSLYYFMLIERLNRV